MKIMALRSELTNLYVGWKAIADQLGNSADEEDDDWEAQVRVFDRCARELKEIIDKRIPLKIRPPRRGDGKEWGTRRSRAAE